MDVDAFKKKIKKTCQNSPMGLGSPPDQGTLPPYYSSTHRCMDDALGVIKWKPPVNVLSSDVGGPAGLQQLRVPNTGRPSSLNDVPPG